MDAVCSDYSTAFQFDYIRLRIETKRNIFHLPYGFDQNHWNVSSNSLRLECVCEVYHTIWIFIWNVIDKKTYSKFFCSNCEPTLPKQGRKLNILFPVWHLCVCACVGVKWNEMNSNWFDLQEQHFWLGELMKIRIWHFGTIPHLNANIYRNSKWIWWFRKHKNNSKLRVLV